MRKAAHPSGGMGSSNPRRWRGKQLHHHGDGVCHVVCAFLCSFWLVTCQSYSSYLRFRGVTKWATQACTIPVLGHNSWSENDLIMSWLRMAVNSNCFLIHIRQYTVTVSEHFDTVSHSICVTWALGREVRLPYYDHLRSRLLTSPLSLLLTRIKGWYKSTTYPQLPPTTHSFLFSGKVMSADFGAVCLSAWSNCITSVKRTHLCLSAVLIQLQGYHFLYPDSYASRQSSCSHHHWQSIDPLIRPSSWHSQNIGLFTTYITVVENGYGCCLF